MESQKFAGAFHKCYHICTDLLIKQLDFLKKRVKTDNKVVQYVCDRFGQNELLNCVNKLGFEDLDHGTTCHHKLSMHL